MNLLTFLATGNLQEGFTDGRHPLAWQPAFRDLTIPVNSLRLTFKWEMEIKTLTGPVLVCNYIHICFVFEEMARVIILSAYVRNSASFMLPVLEISQKPIFIVIPVPDRSRG